MISADNLDLVLETLGAALARRGSSHELLVVGGSALLLGRYGVRPTRDVDVMGFRAGGDFVSMRMPPDLVEAAEEIRPILGLDSGWLNIGPMDRLEDGLPAGYESRLQSRSFGPLTVHFLGRPDLLALKLLAACDPLRGSRDMIDLRILAPEPAEVIAAARWVLDVRHRRFRSDVVFLAEQLGAGDASSQL